MEKRVYLSSFCVNFQDYQWLRNCIDHFEDFPVGVEFATWWELQPDMPQRLDSQVELFRGIPATIHSPFYEICNEDGSEGQKQMTALFDHACKQYHAFNATSMVIHTNEGKFPKEKQELAVRRILELHEKFKAQGIPMTVENVGYPHKENCLFPYEDFIKLFDQLPEDIGCLIDTGHAMLNDWDIVKLIETLGPRIRGYHLNNNNGSGDSHYPCFDSRGYYNEQQMEDVIAAIAKYSPDADLILEYAPGPHITEELMHTEIRRVVSIMEKNLK